MDAKQFTKESALQYSEETRLIIWLVISFLSVSVGIITLFGYFRFNQISNLIIIRKRYPQIVFVEVKLSMIGSFILLPLMQCSSSYLAFVSEYHTRIPIITWSIYPVCHWLVGCEVARLWLICYDLNYLKATQNSHWKQQISTQSQTNWWIENRTTYGSYRLVTRVCAFFFFCTGAIVAVMYCVWGRNSITMLIDGALYGMPITFIMYSCWKCPKIVDKFFFQFEFRTTIFVFVTALCFYFVGQVIAFVNPYIGEIAGIIDGIFAFSGTSLVSTLWVPYRIMSKKIWIDQWNCDKQMTLMVASSSIQSKHKDRDTHCTKSPIPALTEVFSNEELMESFVLHLSHEFSLECFLSFFECIQFKSYLNEIFNGSKDDCVVLDGHEIKFMFDAPLKSSIVYESFTFGDDSNAFDEAEMIGNFKSCALALYQKYIRDGCELEVNIDGESRRNYDSLLTNKERWMKGNVTVKDLDELFDPLCRHMYELMGFSLMRFFVDSK